MGKKVQIVSDLIYQENDLIKVTRFSNPNSLGDYDINVISTLGEDVWKAKEYQREQFDMTRLYDDYLTLYSGINSSSSCTLLILPQNYKYTYCRFQDSRNNRYRLLKDTQVTIHSMVAQLTGLPQGKYFSLIHGKTETTIGCENIESDFTFSKGTLATAEIVTKSKGKKATTIKVNRIILTTLNLDTSEKVELFLKHVGLLVEEKETEPEWIGGELMFDDEKQNEIIALSKQKIAEERTCIQNAEQKLSENKRLKSILYTTGDELVEVINDIMSDMFAADLSNFVDKRKEDFAFSYEDKVIIGEIKGINDYVKRTNLSQLDAHFSDFIDRNEETDENNVKKILIINPKRKLPIQDRAPIDNSLIQLAKNKYGQLIIETIDLLKLYEDFKDSRI
ncbi:MAG: hypothetical protein RR585_15495, partial [Coprobacillus sp.]